jgi:hypothetical protein
LMPILEQRDADQGCRLPPLELEAPCEGDRMAL